MSSKLLLTLLCCALAVTGCNLVYKQNVQQGNAIEQEKLDQLKLGMTMTQVAYLMGTPAVRDPFHQSRWDYIYTFAYRGGKQTTRKVTLQFENAILKEMTGIQDPASGTDAGPAIAAEASTAVSEADTAPADEDKTLVADEAVISTVETPVVSEASFDQTEGAAADLLQGETEIAAEPVAAPAEATDDFVAPLPAGIPLAETNPNKYLIQLGAYDSLVNARNLVDRVRGSGFEVDVYVQQLAGLGARFLVRSPGYESRVEAERQLQQINSAFELDGFLIFPSAD